MPVSYLTSIPTSQPYSAKALFESELNFPELTAEQLPAFLENAERLLLQERRIELSVNGRLLPLADMARNSDDREGAVILKGIADALPRAFRDHSDAVVRELAFYEAAGLIASPAFWQAAEDALKATLNRDTTGGDIRVGNAAQLGMNVTLAKDGKSLECHLSATWKEFTAGAKWHAMTGLEPVMKANVRMLIPLKRKGDGQEVQASFVYLHANSPVPEITTKLKERKTTLGQNLLNALASIPLLGRLFRGVQIKVRVGENFRGHGIAHMPAELGERNWVGTGHQRRLGDDLAACTHITVKRLTRRPNATRNLTAAMAVPPENANGVASLKALLAHRPPELRNKANILEGMNHEAPGGIGGQPPQDMQLPLGDIPPLPAIPPFDDNVANLQSQLQALQQTLEAERRLREQVQTERDELQAERDTAHAHVARLEQRVTIAESERSRVGGELDRVTTEHEKARQKIEDLTAKVAKHDARRAAEALAAVSVEQLIHQQQLSARNQSDNGTPRQRGRAATISELSTPPSMTVANNAAVGDQP